MSYWWLLALAALAGLFVIPSFSIIRQAVIAAVDEDDRRTAISLDSVAVELSFMVGPAAGVWAATVWPTQWVLFVIEMLGVLAGVLLWFANPVCTTRPEPTRGGWSTTRASALRRRGWRGRSGSAPRFIVICLAAAATTLVLGGTDIAIVAALRDFDAQSSIGWVLAVWGFGSLAGRAGLRRGAEVDLGLLAARRAGASSVRRWRWPPACPSLARPVLRRRAVLRTHHHGHGRPGQPGRPGGGAR